MSKDERAIEPGYYSDGIDPGDAERLVLRFPAGDLLVVPCEGEVIRLELSLKGPSDSLPNWALSVRRSEGILVLADQGSEVVAAEARIYVPALFRDIEAHTVSGNLEIHGIAADLLACTSSGEIRIIGGTTVEVASDSGKVEVEQSGNLTAKVGGGTLRCRDISGTVIAETVSGDIGVESVVGNVVVTSTS
ncbi:MAG: hypothetical protein Q8M76_13655, partial [Spirochaetaceae bacterium]|nr:hypothetical protein [Spirochaetaceae bacterium]